MTHRTHRGLRALGVLTAGAACAATLGSAPAGADSTDPARSQAIDVRRNHDRSTGGT